MQYIHIGVYELLKVAREPLLGLGPRDVLKRGEEWAYECGAQEAQQVACGEGEKDGEEGDEEFEEHRGHTESSVESIGLDVRRRVYIG